MKKILPLLFLLFTGCAAQSKENPSFPISSPVLTASAAAEIPDPPSPSPTPSQEERIADYASGLTEDEKIGQLFLCAFRQGNVTALNDEMRNLITGYKIGGVVLFTENIQTEEQTMHLISDLQEVSSIPLFMAIDEEGGRVSRLGKLYGSTATATAIGKKGDLELAYEEAAAIGKRLQKLGFNLDFAPVADLNTNPSNTVIGDRAYGSDPETVGGMVAAAVAGLQDQGIGAVLKHFPGHGDTKEDSHQGRAYVTHDLERLQTVELVPFRQGIEAGALGVMAGHISAPTITGDQESAVFSSFLLQEILENQMDFSGILFTDAMNMGAVTNYYTAGAAAVKAFEAGIDVILMPENIVEAHQAIKEGLQTGKIDPERLDKSVKKIIKTKFILGLLEI